MLSLSCHVIYKKISKYLTFLMTNVLILLAEQTSKFIMKLVKVEILSNTFRRKAL